MAYEPLKPYSENFLPTPEQMEKMRATRNQRQKQQSSRSTVEPVRIPFLEEKTDHESEKK
jgi:hypothetical protein